MHSPIMWQWNEELNKSFVEMSIPHSCRNYNMIVDWAKVNRLDGPFDEYTRVEVS